MTRFKIGTVTYDGLGPAASALTRDRDMDDASALEALWDALSRQPDTNGTYRVDVPEEARRDQ